MKPLLILSLLLVKHFLCDFPLQRPWHFKNKGIYGHPGGLSHAAIHGVGTLLVLSFFAPFLTALGLAALDAVIHYHVDWAKNRLNKHFGFTATSGSGFWYLFGFDQFIHQMTYVLLVVLSVS
jgi:hypothetical protein